jgi:hypothetical protein
VVVVVLLRLLPPLGLLGKETAADHRGSHHHRGRVGWLLLVPVLVVMLVQPAALGSYAVASRSAVPGGGEGGFDPLAAPVRGRCRCRWPSSSPGRSVTPASR